MESEPRWHATPYGDALRWITGEEETGGAYSLHERIAPAGSQSVAHSHSKLVESFYVLEGQFAFEIGGEPRDGSPGSFVSAARGVAHAWRVAGDAQARALVIFAPSAKFAYFDELDALVRLANGGRPDDALLMELMRRYDWL